MTIRVALDHRTTYRFERPVTIHPHTVRLRPAPHSRTPIEAYSLDITPKNHFINWQQDAFGNYLARLVFPEPASELSINVGVVADMTVINPFDFFVEDYAEHVPFSYPADLRSDLEPYLRRVDDGAPGSGPSAQVLEWIDQHVPKPEPVTVDADGEKSGGMRIVDFLVAVNQAVQRDVAYTVRLEPGVQSPDETLTKALGSCRDSAWLLVSVLRELGLAARFVSGYLVQLTSDISSIDGPDGPAADFTDLHAWAEVYVPGAGWIGLDATSGLFAGEGHIPLSCTPHPSAAAPISGATDFVGVDFEFSNTVRRVHEDPRVTKPYSDEQWEQVAALGRHVDSILSDRDVRLTMGGEPTFVSAFGTATPQWESAADGPEKRERAAELAELLRRRWATGGITHHGQGKWYPGEPLPRWQIGLTWRTDGEPLWRDPALLDEPWSPGPYLDTPTEAADKARALAHAIAARLGIGDDLVLPGYEDPLDTVLAEARQPRGDRPEDDVEPDDPALASETGRAGIVDRHDATVGTPAGWIIPVFPDPDGEGWATARWRMRRRHVFLTSGTSPMGLRLPLSSVAWGEAPAETERSTFEERGDLPSGEPSGGAESVRPAPVLPIDTSPRTALVIEQREGHLFAFLPPLQRLEDAVDLLAAIESAAAETGTKVVLEGYAPPGDPRTKTITVTPDPGVIEVNVMPTSSWDELEELTTTLFDDARHAGLATEKFDTDGTHTGTGGGNHITLGGSTPAESPMLRRPDLLRSLITFWQHHPGLSYVFSGKFIGPTSQSPRVDEGRPETLYELELAFSELDAMLADAQVNHDPASEIDADRSVDETWDERRARRSTSQLWLTDRLLRHLLTDITGNTHRSEFCIDKLYSPDSERGRLGLLEMRGFEMPPHPRLSLLQAALVRTLVARFWDEPYRAPLINWGTRLHDRFLLPAFAAADLRDVVADLNRYLAETAAEGPDGTAVPQFDEAWFNPFLEFRFPRLGEVDVAGVHLELRQAIEPWHVLGEEVSLTGTSRYVDSSVERVQIAVQGLVEGRHVVTCNGVPVPLVSTAGAGWGLGSESTAGAPASAKVGGVRFRAWAPPSALHPTIGIHSPLVFDLVDTWNGTSLGGFTYHVVHPGGRAYDDYPVNAAAAESRRASRFHAHGHTTGTIDMTGWPTTQALIGPQSTATGEYPVTVDLRRFDRGHR